MLWHAEQASHNVHKHVHLCNASKSFHLSVSCDCYPHTHTQAHMSERLIGVPNVEDTALIRDWSLQGVSPFNDHPTNQSSFSISLSFFVQVQPHARLNTLFHFLLSPTICPNPSVLSHNFKVLQNQDIF